MVEAAKKRPIIDIREFNLEGYETEPLKKDRYKKEGKVENRDYLQYVVCSTDRKKGVIKYIKHEGTSAADQEHLYSEARLLLRMPHPNIIRIRDVFKSKGEIGMTYERIEDQTLKEKMMTRMSEAECIQTFVEICLAFQMIHDNKVMHKNVRPDHFLIEKDTGRVKVIGFSKLREMMNEKSQSTLADKGLEKAYTPPECVGGMAYTRASDVWVCGLILFQMASGGTFPYPMNSEASAIHDWVAAGGPKDTTVIGDKSPKF